VLELSKETGLTPEEALRTLKEVRGDVASDVAPSAHKDSRSALQLLKSTQRLPHILTFCADIDNMLGGGVAMGEVTEFCGVPGIGKTQLGIQLAVDVHLPSLFGGAEGEAVYIDTEGSFMPQRAVEIAEAFSLHVSKMANLRNDPALSAAANSVATDKILQSIHLFRIHDYVEQIAVIHTLPGFLDQHPKVKLVVIDSIAFHFRHNFEDFALRSRLLNGIAQRLTQIATDREIAVVLVNQVTTKIGSNGGYLAPALGDSWAHACTSRVMLFWEAGSRFARLYKSPSRKCETVAYNIQAEGVRGVVRKRPRASEQGENPPPGGS